MSTAPDQPVRTAALGRRQLLGVAAALVVAPAAVAVASGAPSRSANLGATPGTPKATPGTPGATPEGTPSASVTIEAYEFGFMPGELTVAIGDTVGLFSTGQFPHNFIIEGYNDGAPVDFPKDGSTYDWTVPDDLAPGTYTFYCGVGNHRAQGMEGKITVTEAAAGQTVEAYEFGFTPDRLTVAVGDTVSFFSSGQFPHDFKIDGVDSVDVDFPEDGSTIEWTVPGDLAPGTYTFYCSKPGHREQGMEGDLTVTA